MIKQPAFQAEGTQLQRPLDNSGLKSQNKSPSGFNLVTVRQLVLTEVGAVSRAALLCLLEPHKPKFLLIYSSGFHGGYKEKHNTFFLHKELRV